MLLRASGALADISLLDQVAENAGGTVEKALVDQGFKSQVVAYGDRLGIDVEIVQRNPQERGFVPQPKRWRAEQTYGILILHRRLVRDYEHHPVLGCVLGRGVRVPPVPGVCSAPGSTDDPRMRRITQTLPPAYAQRLFDARQAGATEAQLQNIVAQGLGE